MNSDEREWITNFLHTFPHLTFSFDYTNSTFNPEDKEYREAIVLLAIYPLVLFVLFLFISFCCTCYQCKRQRPQKPIKSCCPGGIIGIILVVVIAAAGVGFYGNQKTNDGVKDFDRAVCDINATLKEALGTIKTMHDIASKLADNDVKELENVLSSIVLNVTAKQKFIRFTQSMLDESNKAKADINHVMSTTPNVSLDFITQHAKNGEFIRWTSTIVVLSVILFSLTITLCGCCKRSRCLLGSAIFIGFFCLLFAWLLNGVYLGASVANSDVCVDPDSVIEDIVKDRVEKDIIKTYIECQDGTAMKYTEDVNDALSAITQANTTLTMISNASIKLGIYDQVIGPIVKVRTQLNYGFSNLTALGGVFACQRTHDNYMTIKDAVCSQVLFNMFLLLVAFLLLSIMMSLLQCILPKMWYNSYKRRGSGYRPVDDADPFVPRPPPYQDYGSLYGIGSPLGPSSNDAINMTGGPPLDSPPPAYTARAFPDRHYRSGSESSCET